MLSPMSIADGLAELERLYADSRPRSRALFERARQVMPSGVVHDARAIAPFPFYVDRAEGTVKWDVDGHAYIDAWSGHGSLMLGHQHPAVLDGIARPVKWIGRQTLKRNRSAAWHPRVLPVCVSKFSIDDCTPSQDVFLSQDHSLFIDGALIPVRHLVNGSSIRFDEAALAAETLEYFHVEFESHEVIYASGLPVESFIYSGGTVAWDNIGEYRQRHGEHRIMSPLAPVRSYEGGFDELGGLIRLAASRFIDVRDPIQIAHDRLKERALLRAA